MNGIGGRTIAEAQASLSYREFMLWMAYRQKRGSLNWGMRAEVSSGRLAALYANSKRNPQKTPEPFHIHEFAPHMDQPQLSLEEAMQTWH